MHEDGLNSIHGLDKENSCTEYVTNILYLKLGVPKHFLVLQAHSTLEVQVNGCESFLGGTRGLSVPRKYGPWRHTDLLNPGFATQKLCDSRQSINLSH